MLKSRYGKSCCTHMLPCSLVVSVSYRYRLPLNPRGFILRGINFRLVENMTRTQKSGTQKRTNTSCFLREKKKKARCQYTFSWNEYCDDFRSTINCSSFWKETMTRTRKHVCVAYHVVFFMIEMPCYRTQHCVYRSSKDKALTLRKMQVKKNRSLAG